MNEIHAGKIEELKYAVIDGVKHAICGGSREKKIRVLDSKYILMFDSKEPPELEPRKVSEDLKELSYLKLISLSVETAHLDGIPVLR
ncbi:hypothetical protein NDU88_002826 [Pleurodeles waltl]|uniref:Uncharacterized protein n=1 Tax=Pleurodeles waltl TaxID=8319 RepID=A0AAV7Q833_PLEWA|nr:hypothetical protein NDU88_002826 [Pleurodeles waltl]